MATLSHHRIDKQGDNYKVYNDINQLVFETPVKDEAFYFIYGHPHIQVFIVPIANKWHVIDKKESKLPKGYKFIGSYKSELEANEAMEAYNYKK